MITFINNFIASLKKNFVFVAFSILILALYSAFYIFPSLKYITFISYTSGITTFLSLPLILGFLGFNYLEKVYVNYTKHKIPLWVLLPIYWVLGVYLLNISAFITHIFRTPFPLAVICTYFTLLIVYVFTQHLSINKFYNEKRKNISKKGKASLIIAIIGGITSSLFYLWWGFRSSFTSFNTDSLQNVHLANILKNERTFNLLPINLSGQYTQIDYTSVITPVFAVLTDVINFQEIINFMFYLELVVVALVFITRFYIFKHLKVDKISASLIAFISVIVTFSGLYMSGTIYNQQVLVYCLPSVLYFVSQKYNKSAIFLTILLLPFHFTMSIFLWWVVGSFWFFTSVYKGFSNRRVKIIVKVLKVLSVLVFGLILFFEGVYTFETNNLITQFFIYVLANKPQLINSIGIYSNIAILQIMAAGMGPVLVGLMLCMPIAWVFSHAPNERWSYLVISSQLTIISIPFPTAARTFVFFSVPFSIALYLILKRVAYKSQKLLHFLLVVCVLSVVFFSVFVRSNDLDISGRYWQRPTLSANYQNFLKDSALELKKRNISPTEYKVISEFFIKQHFEVMAYKTDDNGVYEENPIERVLMYEFLNHENSTACQYYNRQYLIYLINERSYKWTRIPKNLASLSGFAIWWSQPATKVEQDYVINFKPKTSGKIIYEKMDEDFNKLILVECV